MKHQKMMTWVSISGTALAIFLVMAFVMADQVHTVETAPESNRSRILIGQGIHALGTDGMDGSTMGLNYEVAEKLYGNLDGIEEIAYKNCFNFAVDVNVPGKEAITMLPMDVDGSVWKIYDFRFIDGRPYDEAEVNSDSKLAVVTASSARALFGEEKVAGREIDIDAFPYRIVGVIEDVNPLLSGSYADIYRAWNPKSVNNNDPLMGQTNIILLMKEGVTVESIRAQVKERYNKLNSGLSDNIKEVVYHEQPYTSKDIGIGSFGSNNGPKTKSHDRVQWIIYSVLIILPAINLSSMTRGRLRHRVAEIGVRRAFGAKRRAIIGQIFGENLLITLLGGIVGFILSMLFLWLASSLLFSFSGQLEPTLVQVNARPDFSMLFRWSNFLWALCFCFVLNVLSATVPAWNASKVEPAEALSASR